MRTLTIESHLPDRGNDRGSKLRLKGRWLAAAGFPPGARVAVISDRDGELVIRRVIETRVDPAWAEATARLHATFARVGL